MTEEDRRRFHKYDEPVSDLRTLAIIVGWPGHRDKWYAVKVMDQFSQEFGV